MRNQQGKFFSLLVFHPDRKFRHSDFCWIELWSNKRLTASKRRFPSMYPCTKKTANVRQTNRSSLKLRFLTQTALTAGKNSTAAKTFRWEIKNEVPVCVHTNTSYISQGFNPVSFYNTKTLHFYKKHLSYLYVHLRPDLYCVVRTYQPYLTLLAQRQKVHLFRPWISRFYSIIFISALQVVKISF